MKKWAVENGVGSEHYAIIIEDRKARGWKQTSYTGFEVWG